MLNEKLKMGTLQNNKFSIEICIALVFPIVKQNQTHPYIIFQSLSIRFCPVISQHIPNL